MKITQFYPVLMVDDVAQEVAFFQTHLGFQPTFEANWYVHLQSSFDAAVNIAILQKEHQTIPEMARGASAAGLLINFEVEDVDALYDQFVAAGVPILQDLTDEDFGQRHFIARTPQGSMIDVIKPIPPSKEFLAQYAEGAAAS